ncbi:MAG: Gar1/Naf1 family protein [Candidatus Methanoperedens sp.]|nr:Gar1/Naf1 family protein [Candidatus Methanoperedens sp.]MCZ7396479.1 Gar1/Naf1 family protein [Candidatus Methanoperedens sp.]
MKRLGTILHTVDNLLIVRADKTLKTGDLFENSTVVTKNMKKIGRIKEIFGPVNGPYISIKIFRETTGSLLVKLRNERVYLA